MMDDILAIANDKNALAKHLHGMGTDALERYLTILSEETQKELASYQAIATAARVAQERLTIFKRFSQERPKNEQGYIIDLLPSVLWNEADQTALDNLAAALAALEQETK